MICKSSGNGVMGGKTDRIAILTDGRGGRAEWSGPTITVTEPVPGASNPFAKFTIDPAGSLLIGQEFTVDASLSFDRPTNDPNARIESYTWDFDDGTAAQTGITATHAYTAAGTYTITLVVTDPDGNFGRAEDTVQVTEELPPIPPVEDNRAPVAVMTINPSEGFEGVTEFSFDARGSSDPDGDDITFTWAFGDGSSPMAAEMATHVYARPGVYVVRLTVRDVFNATTDATQSVVVLSNVGNLSPVALIGTGRRSGPAPLTITFDGRISYDPNGDDLDYTWEFRQGQTLLDTLTGSTVTRLFADEGTYSIELIVDDRRGGTDRSARENIQVTAQFTPEPPPPLPTPDDEPPPPSWTQRPGGGGVCGLGMVMTLCGSWIGLTLMRVARRRFRL
jgi:PKD repeat protein